MSQLPSTPTSLAPISPSPLNTSFFIQQQQDGLISPVIKEEISTIFVVGFPEDMQEREFQNMFMFSPGFEAATLKVPNGNKDEEDYLMNGNNGRKQIVSNHPLKKSGALGPECYHYEVKKKKRVAY
jgi:hypothetical protein